MSKLNVLSSGVGFESVQAEATAALDIQGKPGYVAQVTIKARVVRGESVVRKPDGSETVAIAELWVDVTQPALPLEEWRLTMPSDGLVGIVIERLERRTLTGVVDHIKLKLRRE